jgi:uncharacterized RDD family membrane protein YckC
MATTSNQGAESSADYVLYSRIWPRMKAILIDGLILAGAFFLAAFVGANVAGSGPTAFVLWALFWVLYDPLLVSRTGGTVGHHVMNLRVVSDSTGRNPSFLRAFFRNIVKGTFGMVSLLAVVGSAQQKAIHDWIGGTTVQARNLQLARSRSFVKVRRHPAGQDE